MVCSLINPNYYILYIREGQYFFTATQSVIDTFHRIEFITKTLKLLVVGVVDRQDDQFKWSLPEVEKLDHQESVETMLKKLKATKVYQAGLRLRDLDPAYFPEPVKRF